MLIIYVEAPFAACRTFTAGWYRPTATFLAPSTAYGLLLNIAGINSRLREEDVAHDGRCPATYMRTGLPSVRIALGAAVNRYICGSWQPLSEEDAFPRVQAIYQQLHNYPVGASGQERADSAFGTKYNIAPVRRELLVNLRAMICADGNPQLEDSFRAGLAREPTSRRYGLPFLGDNSFLPDRILALDNAMPAFWYERLAEIQKVRVRTTRLTCWIDRADLSRTHSALYAPTANATADIPSQAWTDLVPP
jgi:CRISPR-associated protein Cas5t